MNHKILLSKLYYYGFIGIVYKCYFYLSCCQQYVNIENVISHKLVNNFGVPQGLHYGPLLFLILMTFFNFKKNYKLVLYADDATLSISHENLNEVYGK